VGKKKCYDVLIIGGGLAGLTCALHLGKAGVSVLLIEKYAYPHHKVCGEYVSNEVLSYLQELDVDPFEVGAPAISNFQISDQKGRLIETKLPLGGFGISRYAFDKLLYERAKENATIVFNTIIDINFSEELFSVQTSTDDSYEAKFVVGAFGKRSNLDKFLNRKFAEQKSPWLAVKAHYQYDMPNNLVALHNFEGGYCGLSKTENGAVNACYLTTYSSFKKIGDITKFEKEVLSKNPYLNSFFNEATPLFKSPLTISQISFDKKSPIENHIFMIGDSAGLIHPLCGNGMAMAIHSAKLFSELYLTQNGDGNINRSILEQEYTLLWNSTFKKRLKTGRSIQNLLLSSYSTSIGFTIAKLFPNLVPTIIKKTHGNPL